MFRSLARAVAVAGATALALTACGGSTSPAPSAAPAGTVSVTDATGQVVDVPTSPTRVVVFDMSLLDSLDTLGVPVAGLPKQNVPEFLAEYRDARYADAGTLFEVNLEAVNAADPDLILVAGRSAELKDDLTPIAPTLDLTTDSSRLMADYERNARTLGTVFGKEAEVEKRLGELNTSITETKGLAADAGRGLIVLTSGTEATAYGPGSRFGIIHDVLGVPPAIPDVEAATHGEAISFELIAQTNPDRMFVVDRDAATGNPANAQQVLNNELVTGTAAWRNGDVTYLDPTRWYIANAGLSTLPASVEEIRASLQAA
jgi:iron complex transport system substrate-binding protein